MPSNGSGSDNPCYLYPSAGYGQQNYEASTPRYAGSVRSHTTSSSASQSSEYSSDSGIQSYYAHVPDNSTSYDEFGMPRAYSETPSPSAYTALTTFSRGILQQQAARIPNRQMLHCEFQPWTGCREQFQLDEVDAWIRHTDYEHLQGNFPTKCICWFCDDFVFSTQHCTEARHNFTNRMKHIADHILDGDRFEQRRPDFHYLDHVYKTGKVSRQAFEWAKDANEGPRPLEGVHPYGWRPARREAAIVMTSGSERRQKKRCS
ncbi:hypothetical protein CGRA01v4_01008 [Colletotrichum graminicola]|uniref:Uncharacterized protein n=1 Tax=Colletotrichum graminicola (strain M1.001 / M2 / FGSC 10212) TaxID=645133 RepID=E3QGV0_COLGM|nr:uncharacterized protein GLRG_05232 [Colletotrichum graminicola M1.001]EFQ30088.1 hypothetical protein GLRG_05232 [Colletotrichum graminicola M1.001]WDK09730.1 hypothetical protein CGRA01v4_01008 [Colletotrichum graminicola]